MDGLVLRLGRTRLRVVVRWLYFHLFLLSSVTIFLGMRSVAALFNRLYYL